MKLIAEFYPLQQKILDFCNSGRTRQEIVERFNLPWTTTFDILMKLAQNGKIDKNLSNRKKNGRPKVYWKTI